MRSSLLVPLLVLGATVARAAPPEVSLERFYSLPSLIGTEPRGATWSPDGRTVAFLWNEAGMPFLDVYLATPQAPAVAPRRVTRLTHVEPPVAMPEDPAAQKAAVAAELDEGVTAVSWHPDGKRLLFAFAGDLYLVMPGGEPARVTDTPKPELKAALSRTGRLAFIRESELFVAEPAPDGGFAEPARVTAVARPGAGIERFVWSPDGRGVAVVEVDRLAIVKRRIADLLPDELAVTELPRAFPGEDSEHRRVGLVAPVDGGVRWVDLGMQPTDLVFSLAWSPRGDRLLADVSDVMVKDRRLQVVDVATGAATVLVREQEPLNVTGDWQAAWAPDGERVYFTSDRAHDMHVWQVSARGGPPRAITSGPWAVFDFTVTPAGIVAVANAGRPEERVVLTVPLGAAAPAQVSWRPGTHAPVVSPDGRWAAVVHSSDQQPFELYLTDLRAQKPGPRTERQVTTSPAAAFGAYTWVSPRYVTFPSRTDGVTLHGRLQLPPGARPGERLPVIVGSIYSNTVRNQWGGRTAHPLWGLDRVLLEKGFALFTLDVAGSAGHGTAFRRRIRLDYGGIDVDDIHSGVEWLVKEGIADPSRVGIWGSSYGGLLTTMSLFTRPGVYRAGVAGAPATNVWHALTGEQRVMGRPQEHPQAYRAASSHTRAAGLSGALLIIHGMRDPIVLYRDSVWLTHSLVQLGRDVELLTLPDASHGWDLGPRAYTRYAFGRLVRFFEQHLSPATPPCPSDGGSP